MTDAEQQARTQAWRKAWAWRHRTRSAAEMRAAQVWFDKGWQAHAEHAESAVRTAEAKRVTELAEWIDQTLALAGEGMTEYGEGVADTLRALRRQLTITKEAA